MWLWERADDGTVSVSKVISIPAEPAEADQLPPLLQPFGAVPPLITDISLSVDDKDLYVSCWGTGEPSASTSRTRGRRARPAPSGSAGSSPRPRTRPAGP